MDFPRGQPIVVINCTLWRLNADDMWHLARWSRDAAGRQPDARARVWEV